MFRSIPNKELSQAGLELRIAAELRAAGLRATAPRRAIVRELLGDTSHPTAQQLFERLEGQLRTLSFATVYNTLRALNDAGHVGRLELGGAARFDPNVEPHHHAICESCGEVRDVPAPKAARAPRLSGFRISRVDHVYRGVCAPCLEAETQTS
ncbi:MAG: transcriptional repressor [Deltaproteobacteria bacterium]|nr:transcriptional repressor [Deltaproteobacteria bacterium]